MVSGIRNCNPRTNYTGNEREPNKIYSDRTRKLCDIVQVITVEPEDAHSRKIEKNELGCGEGYK